MEGAADCAGAASLSCVRSVTIPAMQLEGDIWDTRGGRQLGPGVTPPVPEERDPSPARPRSARTVVGQRAAFLCN